MNGKKISIVLFVATALLMTAVLPFPASAVQGPRTEDLELLLYSDIELTYAAMKAGIHDLVMFDLTVPLFTDASEDPDLQVAPIDDMGMYEIAIDNNWTIKTYPGVRSPTSYPEFRQAMAFLTDKDYIIDVICEGFAVRIDQPIAAPSWGWMNETYLPPNYPYEYDLLAAAALLDAKFPQGMTPNPYYDPAFSGSAEYIRTYPADHPTKAGLDLDGVKSLVRTDDLRRLYTGRLLYENMQKHGIPIALIAGPMADLLEHVKGRDYHWYTGGWGLGKYPLYTYSLFHSYFWIVAGANRVTGMNESNLPNYPELDDLLYNIYFAESVEASKAACQKAMGLFTELCVLIPLWSTRAYWAYSADLLGVPNMDGYGPENGYTFMNAYKADATPVKMGIITAPKALNVLYSSWVYDYQCLDRMSVWAGIGAPPYDIMTDQASWVQDWHTSTWFDPEAGENKTKVTKWFRTDAYFAAPVTGDFKGRVNVSDYLFSAFYGYALEDHWHYGSWMDVHHYKVVDEFCVEIYYDATSYWLTYAADGPMLPRHVWLQTPLTTTDTSIIEYFHEGTNVTTPGVVPLTGEPVWIESVTADGVPLTMFIDYNWVKGQLEIYNDYANCTDIHVDYWAAGSADGYFPGDLPWETILEGAGMYYAVDLMKAAGGYLRLKRNPYYFLETPPLGEVDFVWKWGARDGTRPAPDVPEGPRTGYYKIDIYDVVLAAGAYGSQGSGVPDTHWFPGADIASPGGKIDIYDIVTICGKYGTEWGHPPLGIP